MERRRKLIYILIAISFGASCIVHADQFNDLYYIDPGGVPDLTEEGRQNDIGGTSPSGSGSVGAGSSGNSAGGTTAGGSSGNSSSGAGTGVGGGINMGPQTGQEEDEEQGVLESLLETGAIQGGLGGIDEGIFSGGQGSIVVSGSRVRAFLRKDPDIDEVLRYWKIGKGSSRPDGKTSKDRLTPGEYYALVAATLAAEDEGIEEVLFTARDFTITYRSRGALFALIPWSFPVRVFVAPTSPKNRVVVRFPWYHWFVREYFTRAALAQEVEGVIQSIAKDADVGEDIQAELFDAVARMLREKVRTITESILLK